MALKNKQKLIDINELYAWLTIDTDYLKENK